MKSIHFTRITIPYGGIHRFADKLPAKAAVCCGIHMSATTHHATQALAQVAVSFNGGKDMTINEQLVVKPHLATKSYPLVISQPLDANTKVTGYVNDYGLAPAYPYDVMVYYTLNS